MVRRIHSGADYEEGISECLKEEERYIVKVCIEDSYFTAKMSSPTSTQYSPPESACRTPPQQAKQLRPKPPLLKILQAAGAQGETFTLKELVHWLGDYISQKQLYDKEQQHIVYCGNDPLGDLLGCERFTLNDPRPVYEMLKRNVTSVTVTDFYPSCSQGWRSWCSRSSIVAMKGLNWLHDAAQRLALAKDQSMNNPSQDQLQSSTDRNCTSGRKENEVDIPALSVSNMFKENEDNLSKEQHTLDLVLEEWDVAGLPWWFLGNLRNNYKSRSNGSTDILANQDVDTTIVSDTTDDLWFLNEAAPDQLDVTVPAKMVDCDYVSEEGKDGSKTVSEAESSDDFEDLQSLNDDTDMQPPSKDYWQCTKCKKFNSPIKRYCFRCWALRKDWFSDCPMLAHSLSLSNIATMQGKEDIEGIDVPDCRRTVSAPLIQPKDQCRTEIKPNLRPGSSVDSLDLAGKEPLLHSGKQKEKWSLETSKELLKPCVMCQKRPRNGNIVHGKTAHLVACFTCAKMLKKGQSPCPVCKRQIQMVIRTFIA